VYKAVILSRYNFFKASRSKKLILPLAAWIQGVNVSGFFKSKLGRQRVSLSAIWMFMVFIFLQILINKWNIHWPMAQNCHISVHVTRFIMMIVKFIIGIGLCWKLVTVALILLYCFTLALCNSLLIEMWRIYWYAGAYNKLRQKEAKGKNVRPMMTEHRHWNYQQLSTQMQDTHI